MLRKRNRPAQAETESATEGTHETTGALLPRSFDCARKTARPAPGLQIAPSAARLEKLRCLHKEDEALSERDSS